MQVVLASNTQIAALFNAFQFGRSVAWGADETIEQLEYAAWQATEVSLHNAFLDLFGEGDRLQCRPGELDWCYLPSDTMRITSAYFGSDSDKDGRYNIAAVRDDSSAFQEINTLITEDGYAYITSDRYGPRASAFNRGVALVRQLPNQAKPVPLPATFVLIMAGLFLLRQWRR